MNYLLPLVFLALVMLPLLPVYKRIVTGKKAKYAIVCNLVGFFALCVGFMVFPFAMNGSAATVTATAAATGDLAKGLGLIGAALATGGSTIGAGIAVAAAASSAIGATSENPKMLAKSLIFVALAEGVALYGMLISTMILGKI